MPLKRLEIEINHSEVNDLDYFVNAYECTVRVHIVLVFASRIEATRV